MNTTLLLNKAGKEVEYAKMQVAVDAKAAQLAHELARAAKVNLKQARKLSKIARKSARKAEDRAEESSATLETAQSKLEILRERIRNEQRKNNPSPKPKLPRGDDDLPHNRPKSNPGKTTMDTKPRVSPVQSQRSTKPAAGRAHGTHRSPQKIVNGKPAKPVPAVAPEPKSVPATRQNLGDLNPLPTPGVAAPSFSGEEPKND
jgi:hypothetical protein